MLVENTFYNNCVNFGLNVTKFGMLINIVDIDKSMSFLGEGEGGEGWGMDPLSTTDKHAP